MNLNLAATLVAFVAIFGYFLMLFTFPTLRYERLFFLGGLTVIAVVLMFLHRKKMRKL